MLKKLDDLDENYEKTKDKRRIRRISSKDLLLLLMDEWIIHKSFYITLDDEKSFQKKRDASRKHLIWNGMNTHEKRKWAMAVTDLLRMKNGWNVKVWNEMWIQMKVMFSRRWKKGVWELFVKFEELRTARFDTEVLEYSWALKVHNVHCSSWEKWGKVHRKTRLSHGRPRPSAFRAVAAAD